MSCVHRICPPMIGKSSGDVQPSATAPNDSHYYYPITSYIVDVFDHNEPVRSECTLSACHRHIRLTSAHVLEKNDSTLERRQMVDYFNYRIVFHHISKLLTTGFALRLYMNCGRLFELRFTSKELLRHFLDDCCYHGFIIRSPFRAGRHHRSCNIEQDLAPPSSSSSSSSIVDRILSPFGRICDAGGTMFELKRSKSYYQPNKLINIFGYGQIWEISSPMQILSSTNPQLYWMNSDKEGNRSCPDSERG